ncbi:MAG: ATP-binding protein [Chitinophagales bacterium]
MSIELQQLKDKLPETEGEERFNLLFDIIEKMHFSPIDEADGYANQILNLAEELNDDELIVRAYRMKCTIYGQQGKYDLYKQTIFKALGIAQRINDKVSIVKTLQSIGNYYVFFDHQFEKARHYLFQALEIAEDIEPENLKPLTHTILASSYGHQSKYEKSMQHSLLAIEGFKKNGDKLKLAVTYNHLSYYLRDENQAIKYAELALEISQEIGNLILQHDNYLALSIYHNDLKQYEKSVYYARKSIKVSQKTKSSFSLAQGYSIFLKSLLNLSLQKEEAEKMKLLEEADQYCTAFEKLLDSANDKKFIESSFLVKYKRGQINYHLGKYSLALKTLQSLVKLDQFKSAPIPGVYNYMHHSYKALGNFEQALHYYQLYAEMVFDKKDNESLKHAEKLQTKFETKEKEKEVERLQELEVLKTRFFTQITHELRTPLTLIQGPAQQILGSNDLSQIQTQAQIIDRNANRLLNLVNQLLDLSKIEAQKMELKLQHGSISNFTADIVQAFQALAIKQQIQLDFITNADEMEEILVLFDADKIEKILYNLLSNAFKFTSTQGRILCQLNLSFFSSNGIQAQLTIEDTGKGIGENELPHIFDRFYQADSSHTRQAEGTGIGLALVKELMELLEGTIEVSSIVGKGTTFTLQLPLQVAKEQDLPPITQQHPNTINTQTQLSTKNTYRRFTKTSLQTSEHNSPQRNKKTPILLLVEDNPDIHTYIRSILENEYIVLQAYNGEEGLQMAQERIPDLIISDVMMPFKDGYELCADLKQDERTSHIPVILLTAKAALQSRIEGFEQGADAYIAKPFHADELRLQSKNLLTTRNNQQRKYQQITLQHQLIKTTNNPEQHFLKKVILVIEQYIDDENLNVNRLSKLLYMSNSQLYRKIQALTNYTVTQFIRNIRLAKAKAMLENGEGNVSEVAFNVGLTPSYFSRCFAKVYGFPPRELIK